MQQALLDCSGPYFQPLIQLKPTQACPKGIGGDDESEDLPGNILGHPQINRVH